MLKDGSLIVLELSQKYSAPKNKLASLEKQGVYHRVVKGLYETDASVSPILLASSIYGPSYISFESALSFWGLIPEKVTAVTSATTCKNRTKHFETPFGLFLYRDVPSAVFPFEVYVKSEGERTFLIAGKEKALCDVLYRESPFGSVKQLKAFVFESLRIEENDFFSMDLNLVQELCPLYHSSNVLLFEKFLLKNKVV